MSLKSIVSAVAVSLFCCPLLSQGYEDILFYTQGNKIILLGERNAEDDNKWKKLIDSDNIYEQEFDLVNSSNWFGMNAIDIEGGERWLRQRYGLTRTARWLALDLEHKLIASGIQMPEAKEFEQMLEQHGIKNPLRQVRDFLRENPDHLDAKTDLLKGVRRRALHVMPPDTTEDLDVESDLRTWAVLANETDRIFNASWLGIDLDFFRPDQKQPERFSKLMKNVFRKHISKVESALLLEPTNNTLWNIWTWMARSLSDYKWKAFIDSFDPVFFEVESHWSIVSIPSADVCVWIIEEAKAKGDWDTVIKYAKIARHFKGYSKVFRHEWSPNSVNHALGRIDIEGYPAKSAYAPHLEALLKLGDIDGANKVYDEMIRREIKSAPSISAEVARSVGMEEVAKIWEKGELINKATYTRSFWDARPLIFTNANYNDDYLERLQDVSDPFDLMFSRPYIKYEKLGWKEKDDHRWALIADDGLLLAQGTEIPDSDTLQKLLNSFKIKSPLELYNNYIKEQGDSPMIELRIVAKNSLLFFNKKVTQTDDDNDEKLWGKTVTLLNKIMREYPEIMFNAPNIYVDDISKQSPLLKSISKLMLTNIELLLARKPSSETLWEKWILWISIEGENRLIEPIVSRLKLSPLTDANMVPPYFVIEQYYKELKKNGDWLKIIELLKNGWDREYDRIINDPNTLSNTDKDNIGDMLGILLIAAYLQDNKSREADDIFNAVLDCGGNLTDISKIVELAKEKGYERLAQDWENKLKTNKQ